MNLRYKIFSITMLLSCTFFSINAMEDKKAKESKHKRHKESYASVASMQQPQTEQLQQDCIIKKQPTEDMNLDSQYVIMKPITPQTTKEIDTKKDFESIQLQESKQIITSELSIPAITATQETLDAESSTHTDQFTPITTSTISSSIVPNKQLSDKTEGLIFKKIAYEQNTELTKIDELRTVKNYKPYIETKELTDFYSKSEHGALHQQKNIDSVFANLHDMIIAKQQTHQELLQKYPLISQAYSQEIQNFAKRFSVNNGIVKLITHFDELAPQIQEALRESSLSSVDQDIAFNKLKSLSESARKGILHSFITDTNACETSGGNHTEESIKSYNPRKHSFQFAIIPHKKDQKTTAIQCITNQYIEIIKELTPKSELSTRKESAAQINEQTTKILAGIHSLIELGRTQRDETQKSLLLLPTTQIDTTQSRQRAGLLGQQLGVGTTRGHKDQGPLFNQRRELLALQSSSQAVLSETTASWFGFLSTK